VKLHVSPLIPKVTKSWMNFLHIENLIFRTIQILNNDYFLRTNHIPLITGSQTHCHCKREQLQLTIVTWDCPNRASNWRSITRTPIHQLFILPWSRMIHITWRSWSSYQTSHDKTPELYAYVRLVSVYVGSISVPLHVSSPGKSHCLLL